MKKTSSPQHSGFSGVNKCETQKGQICFAGFSAAEKEFLGILAADNGLDVVTSVTKNLTYLCIGGVTEASLMKKAIENGASVITPDEICFTQEP